MPHDSSTDEMSLTAVFKSDSALCACANKHKQIGRSIGNHINCCAAYHFVGRRSPTRTQLTPEFAIVLQTEKNEKQTTKKGRELMSKAHEDTVRRSVKKKVTLQKYQKRRSRRIHIHGCTRKHARTRTIFVSHGYRSKTRTPYEHAQYPSFTVSIWSAVSGIPTIDFICSSVHAYEYQPQVSYVAACKYPCACMDV